MKLRSVACMAAAMTILAHAPARAESPYRLQDSQEYWWLGTAGALWLAGSIAITNVDPLSSADIAALDTAGINDFDRKSMEPYRDDHAGDAMALTSFLLPFSFLARDDMRADAGTLGTMWLEATALSQGLAFMTKAAVQRARPYAYDPNAPAELKTKTNARLSFYSAHTTASATNSFFMARVFSDYSTNRTAEIAVWSGAVVYSVVTGFFRVDSGHHFTTDTITGFVVGAAIGYLVPVMHRNDDDDGVSIAPETSYGTFGLSATFTF